MSNTTQIVEESERETAWQKTMRRFKEEPMVPLGMALTTVALVGATQSMRHGDRNKFNKMLRFRVIAQGFTVVAALGGSIYYGDKRRREKLEQGNVRDKEKRDREFNEQMKLAEAASVTQPTPLRPKVV
ncbi:Respiratory supercomplex factor 1, mitochondrial [Cystobasidiomycetes sp. EMM_F5]